MPTEPLRSILDPEIAIEMHRESIEIVSPLLDEIVNYSTHVFQRCQHSAQGSVDEDIPILMIYLQMIEMADGVRVLLSQSCSVASTPLVRSLFESILSVKYILEQESEFQKRSYALLVNSIHNQLAKHQTLDSSTQKGQEFTHSIELSGKVTETRRW